MHLIIRVISIMLQLGSILIEARPQDNKMPSNCRGQNYCTDKSKSYPQTVFNRLLGSIDAKDTVLTDNIDTYSIDIEQRFGSDIQDGCHSKLKDKKIYEIIDHNGDLRYVAQMEGRFTQEIRINVCENPGRVNSTVPLGSIPDDVNVSCVEMTLDFNFLVLKKDKSGLELAQARGGIPVACMCKVIKSPDCDID